MLTFDPMVESFCSTRRYGGGFTSWGQPFRLRHLVTGRFLGVKLEKGNELQSGSSSPGKNSSRKVVALLSPSEASDSATAFRFVKSAVSLFQQVDNRYFVYAEWAKCDFLNPPPPPGCYAD